MEWLKPRDVALFAGLAEQGLAPQVIPSLPDFRTRLQHRTVRTGELRWLGLGTALLLSSDASTLKWFDPDIHEAADGDDWGKRVSRLGTGVPLAVAILAPALVDGRYGRKTARLTAVALLNATLLTGGLKFATGRERPDQSGGRLRFHGPGSGFSSFPSGHAAAASAVATVLGHRYPRYKLLLYGLAGAVALGRINAARHFPSDVLVGVSIGIYHGRLVLRDGGKVRLWR
jgi:membrane-associated phospholipid phosphatase